MDVRDEQPDLSMSEKILRLQDEWDQIASSADELGLTREQLEELRRRVRDHHENGRPYRSWEEVKRELESLGRHGSD